MAKRVLIADDHALVRETIAAFLAAAGDMNPVSAPTLGDAIAMIAETGPFGLLLLDYDMPGMCGLEGLARAVDANACRPVALISGVATRGVVAQALDRGAAGFVPKTMPASSLVNVIRFMVAGERFVPSGWLPISGPATFAASAISCLSKREQAVLAVLEKGKSNKEIADDLGVGPATVKHHLKRICRKLGARNRTRAAVIARNAGLI